MISTEPIGPVVCPANPVVVKSRYRGSGKAGVWEFEIASDESGREIVFRSRPLVADRRARVDSENGRFVDSHAGRRSLRPGTYYLRVRQADSGGTFSNWSHWHQGYVVR